MLKTLYYTSNFPYVTKVADFRDGGKVLLHQQKNYLDT